jgi:hypothetical protein
MHGAKIKKDPVTFSVFAITPDFPNLGVYMTDNLYFREQYVTGNVIAGSQPLMPPLLTCQ